jgi:hypothetical protein
MQNIQSYTLRSYLISNNDITMCKNRIQTYIFDVVYVSETGRIVNILLGRTCARYDQLTDLIHVY